MSEAGIAVYINPVRSLRIGCAAGVAVGEGSGNIDFGMAASGDKNSHIAEIAVEFQQAGFRKLPAACQIQD